MNSSPKETGAAEPLKWGILGAARIAAKSLIPAMRGIGGEIVAVGASSRDRAEAFAKAQGIARAYEGYQRVLDDADVEAVYIPLANGLHLEWGIKTARAGKACLCEKPMTLTAADAETLCSAFSTEGQRLQEAFMWRHHAQAAWLAQQVKDGALGELKRVSASFSFNLVRDDDYRWKADQGGGALWDIGCYGANAARFFFDAEPVAASARAILRPKPDDVDESAVAWLDFGAGRLATINCSFRAAFCQGIELVGTEGRAVIHRPWLQVGAPTEITIECDNEQTVQAFDPMNAYEAMLLEFTRSVRNPSYQPTFAEDGRPQAIAMEGLLTSAHTEGTVWTAPS